MRWGIVADGRPRSLLCGFKNRQEHSFECERVSSVLVHFFVFVFFNVLCADAIIVSGQIEEVIIVEGAETDEIALEEVWLHLLPLCRNLRSFFLNFEVAVPMLCCAVLVNSVFRAATPPPDLYMCFKYA